VYRILQRKYATVSAGAAVVKETRGRREVVQKYFKIHRLSSKHMQDFSRFDLVYKYHIYPAVFDDIEVGFICGVREWHSRC